MIMLLLQTETAQPQPALRTHSHVEPDLPAAMETQTEHKNGTNHLEQGNHTGSKEKQLTKTNIL